MKTRHTSTKERMEDASLKLLEAKPKKKGITKEEEDRAYFGKSKSNKGDHYTPPADAPHEVKELLNAKNFVNNVINSKMLEPGGRQPPIPSATKLTQEMLDRIQEEMRSF